MSLVNFIKLPAKMFQLYMGKFSFDLPMEESKKSWLFDNGLIYLKMAAVGPISVSSSFKNATAKFSMNAFVVSCNAFFFLLFVSPEQNKWPPYIKTRTAAYNWKKKKEHFK